MKTKNVFWGVVLVSVGILFVLRNAGMLHFNWYQVLNLWPVFLIVLGVALLPIKGVVRIILAFLVIVLSLIFISNTDYYHRYRFFEPDEWRWWDKDEEFSYEDEESEEWRDQQLFETYSDEIENAVLDLDAIAGEFTLKETTDYLIKFNREGNFGKYYLYADREGSAVVLKLDMDSYLRDNDKVENRASISLHPDPVWDMQIDAGAAKIDFDLSPYKIDRIDIDGGASSVKIRLGDRFNETRLSLNSGAAATQIEVPLTAGCEVLTNTILSSKTLDGFDKIENGVYRSDNFDTAENKIFIEVNSALSSLKVLRY